MQGNYSVRIEKFATSHFIKSFEKKYKGHWDVTLRSIIAELERIDALLNTNKADEICGDDIKIVKTDFRVAGTKESAKSSGNRCVVAWHKSEQYVSVLLVYAKTDLSGSNETVEWKGVIKNNYPEYAELL